jgi:hypothetical protein
VPAPAETPAPGPEGSVPREMPAVAVSESVEPQVASQVESPNGASVPPHADSGTPQPPPAAEAVSVPHEKSSDDNAAV